MNLSHRNRRRNRRCSRRPVQQRMAPPPYGAPRRGGGFRAACGFDAERLCAGVPPGGGRDHRVPDVYRPRALSPPCRSFLAGPMGAGPGYGRVPVMVPRSRLWSWSWCRLWPRSWYMVAVRVLVLVMVLAPAAIRAAGAILRPTARFRRARPDPPAAPPPGGQPGNAGARKRALPKRRRRTVPRLHRRPELRQARGGRAPPPASPRPRLQPMNERPMPAHCGNRRRREISGRRFVRCRLGVAVGVLVAILCLPRHAAAESVTNCVNRCQMICGYFPDNPECKRQADRCVIRCKRAKGD